MKQPVEPIMTKVAYIRVSTEDQNLDVQSAKVSDCDKVFAEKRSGASGDRPALRECLSYLREGDTLVCTRADRLARSTLNLLQIMDELATRGVSVVFLDQPELNSGSAQAKLMLQILGAVAEFERNMIRERQAEGIAKAKANGAKFGRPSIGPEKAKQIKELREAGATIAEIQKAACVSRATVYRTLSPA